MTDRSGQHTEDALMLEFLKLPESITESPIDEPKSHFEQIFLSVHEAILGIRNRMNRGPNSTNRGINIPNQPVRNEVPAVSTLPIRVEPPSRVVVSANSADIHFASHGSYGVVDLGASKTVIGSSQVGELMQALPEKVRRNLSRSRCNFVLVTKGFLVVIMPW